MEKKRCIVIALLFFFLNSLEIGIYGEVVWHGWGGFGDISLEYTTRGTIGTVFLILLIPVSVIVLFLIRIMLCIKKTINVREFFLECICALFGIGIAIALFFLAPGQSIIVLLGRTITAFIIDTSYDWMTVPIAG